MLKTLCVIFLLTIIFSCVSSYGGYRATSGGKTARDGYIGSDYNNAVNNDNLATDKVNSPEKTRRGLGISAWGIITLTICAILGGMGLYYFTMCYPLICKKERNYDIIEMTTSSV